MTLAALEPIGVIRSPFAEATGTPIQPVMAGDAEGTVEVFPPYAEGLRDLDGFDRIWLIYGFDRAARTKLTVTPYMDTAIHGVFATRAPCRPNPVGLSNVRLLAVEGCRLTVSGIDMLDRTPLLDIKPYVPRFDVYPVERTGWIDRASRKSDTGVTADNRFESEERSEKERGT